ncbi:NnrS protein involved in response to NO [Thioalkalivibrio nitratireducens DSM 14787]|uniref:NnrS protein involved in response to NO n=1 Tax=Thioalkalivibrio nitratireducens (strain DSM 14787 / UNIQEM 213 / ALEN2) TaxID=1255043 RepID=L0DWM5_THIND|nr:NnrS protein involved in response to NO [Thioalkalivibrio nitratireducens DSM 14787]
MLRTLFSIGFRPFFLAAGWFGAAWVLLWVSFLLKGSPSLGSLHPILWHGHEMLYGLAAAVIAGFLLTASQNWTGLTSTTPASLGALFAVWTLARLGFLFPDWIPLWLTSVADLAFFPLLALIVARVLWRARNRNNYLLVPLLLAFAALNLAIHLDFHGLLPGIGMPALHLTVYLVTGLLVFMGGRVIPYFTERRLPELRVRRWPAVDWATLLATFAILPGYLWLGRDPVLAPLLLAAAVLNLVRLVAWRPWGTAGVPLLWILHVSYFWIPVGFLLQGLHLLGAPVPWSIGIHALMVGALGGLILGMMSRVSLGHTGRPLEPPR